LKSYAFLLFKIRIALKFYLVKLYLESFLFLRDFPGSPAPAAGGLYPPPGGLSVGQPGQPAPQAERRDVVKKFERLSRNILTIKIYLDILVSR
jgi:hypothetical protein